MSFNYSFFIRAFTGTSLCLQFQIFEVYVKVAWVQGIVADDFSRIVSHEQAHHYVEVRVIVGESLVPSRQEIFHRSLVSRICMQNHDIETSHEILQRDKNDKYGHE